MPTSPKNPETPRHATDSVYQHRTPPDPVSLTPDEVRAIVNPEVREIAELEARRCDLVEGLKVAVEEVADWVKHRAVYAAAAEKAGTLFTLDTAEELGKADQEIADYGFYRDAFTAELIEIDARLALLRKACCAEDAQDLRAVHRHGVTFRVVEQANADSADKPPP
jgi:hypothetical protein